MTNELNYYSEMEHCPDEVLDGAEGFYFWMDTEFHSGDYSVPKWAFHCREEKTGVDQVILWGAYQDLSTYDPERGEDQDWDAFWSEIDQIIENELGYCPQYDAN